MSQRKTAMTPILIGLIAAAAIVLIVLIALLFTAYQKATAIPPAPSPVATEPPSKTPAPTGAASPTPFPLDALNLQDPKGVSNLYIEYILDASGSMLETLSDGVPKRDAAKEFLIEHLLTFAPETHFGLRSYGHRLKWQDDQKASCDDIELVAPIEIGQLMTISEWLQDFDTLGMTPLHAAVEQALDDFETSDPNRLNNLILISDGIETCAGDPCGMVEIAKRSGVNFTIHVVGLAVDDQTRSQLSCIAGEGGGVYYDVFSTEELRQALLDIQDDVQASEKVISYDEATQTAMPPTGTSAPSATPEPTLTATLPPSPTLTRTLSPSPTTGPTLTPSPTTAIGSPTPHGCILATIHDFKAVPPQGTNARFSLVWEVSGADRVEIFGNVVDPVAGRFDVWDDNTNYWVLWTKVAGTADDCYLEEAIRVDPDAITPAGTGLKDVTVSQQNITISVRDNAAIDGDRVDLFLNGEKILSNYTLTSSAYGVNVKLKSGENQVTVVALNEGDSSPNTVEVSISHVTKGDSVQVSQGLKTGQSASFMVVAP